MAAGRHPVCQGCGVPLSEMGSIMGLFASRPMVFRPFYERWLEGHNHPFHYEHLFYKGVGTCRARLTPHVCGIFGEGTQDNCMRREEV